jgi:hypothetical protein
VQALDLAPLGLAAARRAPESVLLLRIAVRRYPFPFLFSIFFSRFVGVLPIVGHC